MPIDAVKEATAEAVADAKTETGYTEPQQIGYGELGRSAPAAQPQDDGDDGEPSAEELAHIDADPRLRQAYRGMVRTLRERTDAAAAQAKEAEAATQAMEALRNNPKQAVRAIAAHLGVGLDERTPRDRVHERMVRSIGREAADVLSPILIDAATEIANDAVGPVRAHVAAQQEAAQNAAIQGSVTKFAHQVREAGGEWDRSIEKEMSDLVTQGQVRPGPNATLQDFMEILHNKVMAARGRSAGRRAAPEPARIRAGMDPRAAVREAVAAARRQVRGR
jgi:hypothetical protein